MKIQNQILITLAFLTTSTFGQFDGEDTDPFAGGHHKSTVFAETGDENHQKNGTNISLIGIMLEWIELDSLIARSLIHKHAGAADAARLRSEIDIHLKSGEATHLAISYIKTRSGVKSVTTSGEELIYPREWSPPKIVPGSPAAKIGSKLAEIPLSMYPASPNSFSTIALGPNLEVEATMSGTRGIIDLNIAVLWNAFEARDYQAREDDPSEGIKDIWQPRFHKLEANAAVTVTDGSPILLSSLESREAGKTVFLILQGNILDISTEK